MDELIDKGLNIEVARRAVSYELNHRENSNWRLGDEPTNRRMCVVDDLGVLRIIRRCSGGFRYDRWAGYSDVYFVGIYRGGALEEVKIGESIDPVARLAAIVPDGCEGRALLTLPAAGRALEKALHHWLGDLWIRDEYFLPGPRLIAYMQEFYFALEISRVRSARFPDRGVPATFWSHWRDNLEEMMASLNPDARWWKRRLGRNIPQSTMNAVVASREAALFTRIADGERTCRLIGDLNIFGASLRPLR